MDWAVLEAVLSVIAISTLNTESGPRLMVILPTHLCIRSVVFVSLLFPIKSNSLIL